VLGVLPVGDWVADYRLVLLHSLFQLSLPSEHSSRQRYLLVPRRVLKILLIVGASSGVGLGFLK
jgi:hypothetical protein